jgi:hypothetical protein
LRREGLQVELSWRVAAGVSLLPGGSWLVRVEEEHREGWRPANRAGRPLDDLEQAVVLRRSRPSVGWLGGWARWTASFELDRPPGPELRLRVRVASRPGFPGFELALE